MGSAPDDLVHKVCRGNDEAASCVRALVAIAHTWDDLIDRDKPVSDELIHSAFQLALLHLPANPFYVRNSGALLRTLANSIINWRIATALEHGGQAADLEIAYILRSSYADVLTTAAMLIGGIEWAVEIGVEVRRFFHSETFNGYLSNLQAEQAARMKPCTCS